MTPPVSAAAKLAAVLQWQTERIRRSRRRVLGRRQAEDVHRLRVALRRLRVAIRLARLVIRLPAAVSDRTAVAIGSSLGKVRDSAVARESLLELQLIAKGREAASLERLLARVERRERKQFDRGRQSLRRGRVRRLLLAVRRAIRRPVALPLGRHPLDLARQTLLAPAWQAVVEHEAWDLPPINPGGLSREAERSRHDLRVRIKELRDALQLLAETSTESQQLIERLAGLAAILGEVRDLAKLRAQIEGTSPVLTALVEGRLTRAAERWETLREEWLGDPSRPVGPPESRGTLVPMPSGP